MAGLREEQLRFDVLGPLRVLRGDESLPLGSVQQRVVLAALLLHVGRPCSRELLIDAVWGAHEPAYAVNLLQKHASAMRRCLEPRRPVGRRSELLTWTEAGYILHIHPTQLDLHVFQEHVRQARTCRAKGDLLGASLALRGAAQLWRGPLCDGLTSPLLDSERERLSEQRIGALEELVEVDLMLGEHSGLVPELRRLVVDHPLRERLRAALMLALYRCGRQGEALAVFRDTRRHLADELGIEPGTAVQRLHEQILAGDPELARTVLADRDAAPPGAGARVDLREHGDRGPAADPTPTLAQLPHRTPDFTGRIAELRTLDGLLSDVRRVQTGPVMALLVGTAGVGKTALAVEWSHRVCERFPDGQLYVNLRGFEPSGSPMDPAEAVRSFLDALAVQPQAVPVTLAAQAALYRSLLTGRRVLIVLDNVRDVEQVRPLLPGSAGCLVVVTSRHELTGLVANDGAVPVAVGLLHDADARELLSHRIGNERITAEPDAVQSMLGSCAQLPLALAIVAARAAAHKNFPLSVLAQELKAARGRLDAFEGGDAASDLRAVFSWSYDRLSKPAARLFRLLGLHPGPDLSASAAAALAELAPMQTRSALAELARAHLVEEVAPGRFAFHDLLRAYAAELARTCEQEQDQLEALRHVLNHYTSYARGADQALQPRRDRLPVLVDSERLTATSFAGAGPAITWFAAEHSVLMAAVQAALDRGLDTHAYELAARLETFLERRGHRHDAVTVQEAALRAARRLGSRSGEAYAHHGLARAFTWRSLFSDAAEQFDLARAIFEGLKHDVGCGHCHRGLGWMLDRQGEHEAALEEIRKALEHFRSAEYRPGLADTLNALGWFHAQLSDPDEALKYCQEALSLHQQIGHTEGEAHTWDSLGLIQHLLGDQKSSVDCYQRALDLWQALEERYYEAATLARAADVYLHAGDLLRARGAWSRALVVFVEYGHPDADKVQRKLDALKGRIGPAERNHLVDVTRLPAVDSASGPYGTHIEGAIRPNLP